MKRYLCSAERICMKFYQRKVTLQGNCACNFFNIVIPVIHSSLIRHSDGKKLTPVVFSIYGRDAATVAIASVMKLCAREIKTCEGPGCNIKHQNLHGRHNFGLHKYHGSSTLSAIPKEKQHARTAASPLSPSAPLFSVWPTFCSALARFRSLLRTGPDSNNAQRSIDMKIECLKYS